MKIICIGRNYAAHIAELNNEIPSDPVVFIKPDTSLLKDGDTFYIPDFSNDIHHEVELVVKISKNGKHIAEKFAHKYYDEISVGIDFTARDVQSRLKEKGLPWLLAKGFDGAAPVGKMIPKTTFESMDQISFGLKINGESRQEGHTSLMLHSVDTLISYVSRIMTLKTGDLIFTGTPAGVAAVQPGDLMEAYLGDMKLLSLKVA